MSPRPIGQLDTCDVQLFPNWGKDQLPWMNKAIVININFLETFTAVAGKFTSWLQWEQYHSIFSFQVVFMASSHFIIEDDLQISGYNTEAQGHRRQTVAGGRSWVVEGLRVESGWWAGGESRRRRRGADGGGVEGRACASPRLLQLTKWVSAAVHTLLSADAPSA